MTEQQLRQYEENKKQIVYYQEKILHLQEKEPDSIMGKVKGSQKDFPFITQYYPVIMDNPKQVDKHKRKIKQYQEKITKLIEENEKIENYIEDITEFQVKRIFELYFLKGEKQSEIAKELHLHQSRISRKIIDYIQAHKNA